MKTLACLTLFVGIVLSTPALADRRVCETVLSGPAGEHVVQLLMEDNQRIHGWAIWRPPLADRRQALPRLSLHYRMADYNTGAHYPLLYVEVMHHARISDSSATSATTSIGPYGGQVIEVRDWTSFAETRDRAERDDVGTLAGGVAFPSQAVVEMAETAIQIHSIAVTDRNEVISEGVWNLTTRTAMDALFARAFIVASAHAENPRRHCRTPNYMDSPMIWDYERNAEARPGVAT